MNKELYYCKYWEHIYYAEYEMCVSDIIYSNDKKMAQIHIIIMKKGRVVRGIASSALKKLENTLREFIRKEFDCENNLLEKGTVKIWYYNIDDYPINSKDVPLRIAITFANSVKCVSFEKYNELKESIYQYFKDFLNEIRK